MTGAIFSPPRESVSPVPSATATMTFVSAGISMPASSADLLTGLSDRVAVGFAVLEEGASDLFQTFLVADNDRAVRFEFFQDILELPFRADDALLRGADDAVVVGTSLDDLRDSFFEIISFVDDALDIARADAQCRTPGAVRRVDHARAAGGDDHISAGNQVLRILSGVLVEDLDQVLRHSPAPPVPHSSSPRLSCCILPICGGA